MPLHFYLEIIILILAVRYFKQLLYMANSFAAPFDTNNEAALVRTSTSSQTGQRVQVFRNAVRSRDRRCVITGKEALGAPYDIWDGFEAAHIFPLAYEEHWKNNNFARWISIHPTAGGSINSIQNGMLLDCTIHGLFDAYRFSIDPDVCVSQSLPNIK